jgi:ATP adenylyltransferase
MTQDKGELFRRVEAVTRSALATGALAPIATQSRIVHDRGVPIELRYVDALAKKDVERVRSGDRPANQQGPFNPFLPYDPALFVDDAGPDHVLILNKFPVIANHVLLITREFLHQEAVVTVDDFVAIAKLMSIMEGVMFFNGGRTGGGSQPHRHFQLMPAALPIEAVLPAAGITQPQRLSVLPFRHAFVHFHFEPQAAAADNGARLFELFQRCCACVEVTVKDGNLSPYNLLITRRWMMVIPRTRELWQQDGHSISLNALGFGGRILVRSPELIDVVERAGAFNILASVTE